MKIKWWEKVKVMKIRWREKVKGIKWLEGWKKYPGEGKLLSHCFWLPSLSCKEHLFAQIERTNKKHPFHILIQGVHCSMWIMFSIYLPCQFFCEENICQLWLAVSLKSEFCEKQSRKSRSQLEIHIVFVTRSRTKRFLDKEPFGFKTLVNRK